MSVGSAVKSGPYRDIEPFIQYRRQFGRRKPGKIYSHEADSSLSVFPGYDLIRTVPVKQIRLLQRAIELGQKRSFVIQHAFDTAVQQKTHSFPQARNSKYIGRSTFEAMRQF